MNRLFLIPLIFVASTSTAEPLSISKTYEFSQASSKLMDFACLQAFEMHIAPNFDGLTGLEVVHPNFFEFSNGTVGIYTETVFLSDYEDTTGVIICSISTDEGRVADIAATFEAGGLDGKKLRDFEPDAADGRRVQKVLSFWHEIQP